MNSLINRLPDSQQLFRVSLKTIKPVFFLTQEASKCCVSFDCIILRGIINEVVRDRILISFNSVWQPRHANLSLRDLIFHKYKWNIWQKANPTDRWIRCGGTSPLPTCTMVSTSLRVTWLTGKTWLRHVIKFFDGNICAIYRWKMTLTRKRLSDFNLKKPCFCSIRGAAYYLWIFLTKNTLKRPCWSSDLAHNSFCDRCELSERPSECCPHIQ